ncbi:MAG TPA: cellulase family glycosylhydrolase [Solirubrobacteraceae bacterium]|jgi:hypothetical protein
MSARLLSRLTALALACVLLSCVSASAAAKSNRITPLGGINIGSPYVQGGAERIAGDIAAAKALHAKLMRMELPWAQFEPNEQGQLNPSAVAVADQMMQAAAAAHIKVIALVEGTPCWASTAPPSLLARCSPGNLGKATAWPPQNPTAYGAFVGWLAQRYGNELAAIEVWNEPDQANQDYLEGPNKPQHYAELLRAAYPAIKSADSNIKVLAGSLVGSNGTFMKALYKQGIKGYYDGVAVHFYTLVLGSVRHFRDVQLENGDHTPLWLDEFGWSSCWPKQKIEQEQGCVTPRVQAENITNAFRELVRAPYIAALLPYDLRDSASEQFGMLTSAGKRKPAFNALSKVLRSPFGSPTPVSLHLRIKSGQVLASGSAPVGDYMRLEAFVGGRLRYQSIFTLNRFNRYSFKLPKVLGTSDVTVLVYQYWLGPHFDAQRSI